MRLTAKEPRKNVLTALSARAGSALWNSLDAETKWRLVKANTAIISKAVVRNFTRDLKRSNLSKAVLAGTLLVAVLILSRK